MAADLQRSVERRRFPRRLLHGRRLSDFKRRKEDADQLVTIVDEEVVAAREKEQLEQWRALGRAIRAANPRAVASDDDEVVVVQPVVVAARSWRDSPWWLFALLIGFAIIAIVAKVWR